MRFGRSISVAIAAAAGVVVAGVAGFVGHQLNHHPKVQAVITKAALEIDREGTRYLSRFGFSCGVEAWSTKVMTDANAGQVNMAPQLTTIHTLVGLTPTSGQRVTPAQVFYLNGTRLTGYKVEPDSDIHLVLKSPITGQTMIAEIPNPMCAAGSVALAQITAARAAFVAQVGQPQTYFVNLNVPIRIQGVGFYDPLHGQTGVAPNGVELHPVLSFQRLK